MENLITNPLNSLNSLNTINPLNTLGSLGSFNPLNLNTSLLSKPTAAVDGTTLVDNVVKTPATLTKTATSTVSGNTLSGNTVTQTTKTVTESKLTDVNSIDVAANELNKKVEVNKKTIVDKKERTGMWRPWLIFVLLFILFMLVLGLSKASIVMTENDQRVVIVDWLKLIVWSLMLAAGFMIIALLIMKGANGLSRNKV